VAVASTIVARRSRLPAASRRRQLLDVALSTFARSGLDATTMDDIAHAAGVTKPLLYQHFKSKRALFLELLDDVVVRIIHALTSAAESAPGPRQQVEAGFSAYFHFVVHNESAIRLLFDSILPHDVEIAAAMRRVGDTFAKAIGPLIHADIDPEHQRVLAAAVVGMAEGVTRDWLRSQSGASSGRSSQALDAEADVLGKRVAEFAWAGLRLVHRDS
jgi:AcrR family transcriptional regulator